MAKRIRQIILMERKEKPEKAKSVYIIDYGYSYYECLVCRHDSLPCYGGRLFGTYRLYGYSVLLDTR